MNNPLGGWALSLLLATSAAACSSARNASEPAANEPPPWYGRTRGSAVVLSRDERVAVVTNRSAGTVAIFELDPAAELEEMIVDYHELDFGEGSEPWAAVIGQDDDTAYVISRHDQTLTRITDLRGEPEADAKLFVGSEPTGLAITPSGERVLVANFGDGTISVITTRDFKQPSQINLNAALVGTGVLGEVEPRAGLAHPRAIAISDDGDDDDGDETLYATEFFSMPRLDAGAPSGPGYFDRNRQGMVYQVRLTSRATVEVVPIAPIEDTGFADSKGIATGCFPNQLYATAVDGDRLFVTSVCASPEGPTGKDVDSTANFKTVMHSVVFVIDTATGRELPEQRQVLTHALEELYAADSDPMAPQRYPLIANDIAFTAPAQSGPVRTGCITSFAADAVFCLHSDAGGRLLDIGAADQRFIDLAATGVPVGRLPTGIAVSQLRSFALVASDKSQNLSLIDLGAQRVVHAQDAVALPRAIEAAREPAHAGRQHFATGLNVWSMDGAARVSCEGCHPDGLSDGITWFFPRGPRRTLSTAGTYYGDGERRVLLWSGNIDEIHDVEGIARGIAGGVGGVLWDYPRDGATAAMRIVYDGVDAPPAKPSSLLRSNLNASLAEVFGSAPLAEVCTEETAMCDWSPAEEWDQIDAYIRSVRAPRPPTGIDSAAIDRGAELFEEGRCAGCHGGEGWTTSRVFYTPGAVDTGRLPFIRPDALQAVELFGRLRLEAYTLPAELRGLNPPADATGAATFRRWDFAAIEPLADAYDLKRNLDDQINCVLRNVGTFPRDPITEDSVAPPGSPVLVREVRHDMMSEALGATGYNSPPLVGLAAAGAYFHAGNARTLEEVFHPAFAVHYEALTPGFLVGANRERDVKDLVAFLLSIDERTDTVPIPGPLDLCAQFQ